MEDAAIVALYWTRDEEAIAQTRTKYGPYCHSIAQNILGSREDAQECVNDTYRGAGNAMPPQRPALLPAFLGKITRNLSLKRWRERTAEKRGGGQVPLALEELAFAIPSGDSPQAAVEAKELAQTIDRFLRGLPKTERQIFLRRYWYLESIEAIAAAFGFGQSKVKMMLLRTRKKLKGLLEKEGIVL